MLYGQCAVPSSSDTFHCLTGWESELTMLLKLVSTLEWLVVKLQLYFISVKYRAIVRNVLFSNKQFPSNCKKVSCSQLSNCQLQSTVTTDITVLSLCYL